MISSRWQDDNKMLCAVESRLESKELRRRWDSCLEPLGKHTNFLKTWKFVISKLCNPYLVQ